MPSGLAVIREFRSRRSVSSVGTVGGTYGSDSGASPTPPLTALPGAAAAPPSGSRMGTGSTATTRAWSSGLRSDGDPVGGSTWTAAAGSAAAWIGGTEKTAARTIGSKRDRARERRRTMTHTLQRANRHPSCPGIVPSVPTFADCRRTEKIRLVGKPPYSVAQLVAQPELRPHDPAIVLSSLSAIPAARITIRTRV